MYEEEKFYCTCTFPKACPYRDEDGTCARTGAYPRSCVFATNIPPQEVDEEVFMDEDEVEIPNYFDRPTEVVFYADGESGSLSGIAYHDEIICLCCGSIYELDEVEIVEMFGGENEENEEWQPL